MTTRCTLTIVIPTFNRPEQLDTCLQSMVALDLPAYDTEVIVVNDGQALPDVDIIKRFEPFFKLQLFNQAHAGPARARNRAARMARGKHLAFLDDDCGLRADWIAQAVAALKKYPDAMLGGKTINSLSSNPYAEASQTLIDYLYECHQTNTGPRFFTGNNIIIPTEPFQRMGGFDVNFQQPGGEDRDLCYRWQQSGGQMVYIPTLTIFHYRQMNLAGFWRQHYIYGIGAPRYQFSRARAEGYRLPRLEPLKFYLHMLAYAAQKRSPLIAINPLRALITLSQFAYAAGVIHALLRQRHPTARRPPCRGD